METTEIIYWSLFAALTIGEIVVVYIMKLPKENVVRDWVEPAFEAIIIATILRIFIIQAFRIPTQSMEDTLLIGDHIIANKFIYGTNLKPDGEKVLKFTTPKRGDVIIFRSPENPKLMFIKRCMGLPGDTMQVKDKVLFINGKKMEEPYVYHKDPRTFPATLFNGQPMPRDNFGPVLVPPGNYFAMGDNRDMSADSRFWGFLPERLLRGKAWAVYWPLNRIRIIKHLKIDAPGPQGVKLNAKVSPAESK